MCTFNRKKCTFVEKTEPIESGNILKQEETRSLAPTTGLIERLLRPMFPAQTAIL